MDGMRYMLKKKDGEEGAKLEAVIWPEPYCYAKTPEEKSREWNLNLPLRASWKPQTG